MGEKIMEELKFKIKWETNTSEQFERICCMYCFKRCDVNNN
jgi:hypothetical protein